MAVLLSAVGVSKSFAHRALFADLSLELQDQNRIGLIGPNGAGKSTLMKILSGLESTDAGSVQTRRGAKVCFLAQDDQFVPGLSCREVILHSLHSESLEDHEKETRAAIALTQLGFEDHDQAASQLSGGWRKRLAFAREFAKQPDFVLIDEPTNHLDLPGVLYLQKLLRSANFGYLVATHDRAFLRAVAEEIVEVSRVYPNGVFRVSGGFDSFAERKEDFLQAQEKQRDAVANQVRRETEWLGRKAAARTRKASSRIQAAMDRREELADLNYRTNAENRAGIDFAGTGRETRKLLSLQQVSYAIEDRPLIQNLSIDLQPGTKLGLLGPNGCGKSTLLKLLTQQLNPQSGTIFRAEHLRIETFEQGRSSLDLSLTLRKALAGNGDTVQYREQSLHVVAWAKKFLFHPEQLELELSALSGGEQARVRMAQMMLRPADLLLLDEPTNDLDLPALELLEDTLEEFPGALVIVSHDRELLDRICTEMIGFDGKGGIGIYASVEQWLTAYEKANAPVKPAAKAEAKVVAAASKPKKLSYKEQQEWDGMESAIEQAETALQQRQAEVEQASTQGHAVLMEACAKMEAAQKQVEKLYLRWQELDAKRNPN